MRHDPVLALVKNTLTLWPQRASSARSAGSLPSHLPSPQICLGCRKRYHVSFSDAWTILGGKEGPFKSSSLQEVNSPTFCYLNCPKAKKLDSAWECYFLSFSLTGGGALAWGWGVGRCARVWRLPGYLNEAITGEVFLSPEGWASF